MAKFMDLTGKTFGRLTVIGPHERVNGSMKWWCLCTCGTRKQMFAGNLRKGNHTVSCGCHKGQLFRVFLSTHGLSKTPEYGIFCHMKERCNNPNVESYKNYGARGIQVLWETFEEFIADMGKRPGQEFQIERVDNDGHYSKNNCRWVTPIEQQNNTRRNHYMTDNEETMTMTQWARKLSIRPRTIMGRLKRGMSDHDALTCAFNTRGKRLRQLLQT